MKTFVLGLLDMNGNNLYIDKDSVQTMHPLGDLSKSREDLATGIKIDEEHFGKNGELGRDVADQLRKRQCIQCYLYITAITSKENWFLCLHYWVVFMYLHTKSLLHQDNCQTNLKNSCSEIFLQYINSKTTSHKSCI